MRFRCQYCQCQKHIIMVAGYLYFFRILFTKGATESFKFCRQTHTALCSRLVLFKVAVSLCSHILEFCTTSWLLFFCQQQVWNLALMCVAGIAERACFQVFAPSSPWRVQSRRDQCKKWLVSISLCLHQCMKDGFEDLQSLLKILKPPHVRTSLSRVLWSC